MHNKKCSNNCQGCQCHKGKDPKVKRHEHEDFEKKSEMNNSWISAMKQDPSTDEQSHVQLNLTLSTDFVNNSISFIELFMILAAL